MVAVGSLMGVGMPDQLAKRLGFTPSTKAGVGTALVGGAALTTNMTIGTTAGGATAFVLPASLPGAGPEIVANFSATTALVFPASASETINGGSAGASVSIAQNTSRIFYRVSTTQWISFLSG